MADLGAGWHYLSFSFDGRYTRLYIDGREVANDDAGGMYPITYDQTNYTLIGAEPGTGNVIVGNFFSGKLDELKIYGHALSPAEIRTDMYSPLSARPASLVAHYHFDEEGTSGVTMLEDVSGNAYHGTLRNFTFLEDTSNWVESYAMVVPIVKMPSDISMGSFRANWNAPTLGIAEGYVLEVARDGGFSDQVVGSPFILTGSTFDREITGLAPVTSYYYRVRAEKASVTGQGFASETITVTTDRSAQTISFAALNPKTTASTDFILVATASSGLAVSYTSSNTAVAEVYQDAGVWKVKIKGAGNTDITASQVGDANYAAALGVVQNLIVIETVLPVVLTSYTAKVEGSYARLEWQTSSETANRGFFIYRGGDETPFVKVAEVYAATSFPASYHFLDRSPLKGNNYYRLVQLDTDGRITELGLKTLAFNLGPSTIELFPNPTLDRVTLRFERGQYHSLVLTDNLGRVWRKLEIGAQTDHLVLDLSGYPAGVFFIQLKTARQTIVKKIIKQ